MLVYRIFYCIFLFGQWKFAFFSLGRPEYLQDSDIVSSRFQVHPFIGEFPFLVVLIPFIFCNICMCLNYCILWYRGEMFMVLGSSILAWSILIMLQKDHMLSTRLVTLSARTNFLKYIFCLLFIFVEFVHCSDNTGVWFWSLRKLVWLYHFKFLGFCFRIAILLRSQ